MAKRENYPVELQDLDGNQIPGTAGQSTLTFEPGVNLDGCAKLSTSVSLNKETVIIAISESNCKYRRWKFSIVEELSRNGVHCVKYSVNISSFIEKGNRNRKKG